MNVHRSGSLRLVQLGAVVLLCSLPGVLLGRVVEGYDTIWVSGIAAFLGTICGYVVARERRLNLARKLLSTFGAGVVLLVVVVAVIPGVTNRVPVGAVVDALLRGWAELATSPIPAFAEPRTVVPVTLVAYLSAAASASCLAKKRGQLLALLAPGCAFLVAVVAAGQHPLGAVPCGLVFVVVSGWMLWVRNQSGRVGMQSGKAGNQSTIARRQNRMVKSASLLGVGALAVAGALMLGPTLTFGRDKQPFDPRNYVNPPSLPASANNPLELVGSRRQSGDRPLFTVRTNEALYPQDLHLVALTNFDGATWSTTASYKRGGAVLDGATRQSIATSSIDADVTISGLDGPWLPSIGDPVSVVGVPFLADSMSGSLVASSKVNSANGASGAVYRLRSLRPEPQVEQLVQLPVGSSEAAREALIVPPNMPAVLTEMARAAIGDSQLPFQRALELRNYLRSSFTLNNAAPSGFSYGHLERAFVNTGSATDEQFATMFATLGRVVGLPTRVVVGFAPPPPNEDGDIIVRGSDARVWAEVLFEEVGWMPFTATPPADGKVSSSIGFGGQDEVELRQSPQTALPTQSPSPLVQPNNPVLQVQTRSERNLSSVFVGMGLLVTLISFGFAGIALVKQRRTARRRIGTPRQAVIGAWSDVLERLSETGVSNTSTMTVEEVVNATEASSDARSRVLTGLYRPICRALYSDGDISEADREQAWRARDRFVSGLNRQSTFHHRLLRTVDPRPLFTGDQSIGARP